MQWEWQEYISENVVVEPASVLYAYHQSPSLENWDVHESQSRCGSYLPGNVSTVRDVSDIPFDTTIVADRYS